MVSQLSARLLMTAGQAASAAPRTVNSTSGSNSSGNASSGPLKRRNLGAAPTLNRKTSETKRGGARKKIPYEDRMLTTATSSSSLGGSSGYLGDFEQKLNTSWPASIDLMSRATKRALLEESTNSQGDNKRSKTAPPSKEELNFMASTVERDLKSGGVQRPKIQVNRSRISSVDMKSVSLIHSKDFDKISSAEKKGFGYNLLDCPGTLHEILKETSCLYNKLSDSSLPAAFSKVLESVHLAEEQGTDDSEKQVDSSDTESSTSSFTEESDSAELSDSSRIQRDLKSPDHDTKSSSRITTDDAPTPVSAVIPIGEALSITSHPKILTLSTTPFNVVQVNAAFHRFTGLTSADVLGKPICDLIARSDGSLATALEESAKTLKMASLRQQTFKTEDDSKCLEQKVLISPVGTESNVITHFTVELKNQEDALRDENTSYPAPSGIQNTRDIPMNVMG